VLLAGELNRCRVVDCLRESWTTLAKHSERGPRKVVLLALNSTEARLRPCLRASECIKLAKLAVICSEGPLEKPLAMKELRRSETRPHCHNDPVECRKTVVT